MAGFAAAALPVLKEVGINLLAATAGALIQKGTESSTMAYAVQNGIDKGLNAIWNYKPNSYYRHAQNMTQLSQSQSATNYFNKTFNR